MRLLVSVFLGAALGSLITVGLIHGFVTWRIHHRQPSKETVGKSYTPQNVFEHTACKIWTTDDNEFFYAIAVGHVDFEPIMPDLDYEYTYSMKCGGNLIVDGAPIEYSPSKRILALNPFGEMQEIVLSE